MNRLSVSMEVLPRSAHTSPIPSRRKAAAGNEPKRAADDCKNPPVEDEKSPGAPPCGLGLRSAELEDAAKQVAEMKAELARLQAKETHLAKMLDQEKENTRRAEQLVEVERIACLELKRKLHLEKRKRNCKGEELEMSISIEASEEEEEMVDDVSFYVADSIED